MPNNPKKNSIDINIIYALAVFIVLVSLRFLVARFTKYSISDDNFFIYIVIYLFLIAAYFSRIYDLRKKNYKKFSELFFLNISLIIICFVSAVMPLGLYPSTFNMGFISAILIFIMYIEKRIYSLKIKRSGQFEFDNKFRSYIRLSYYPFIPIILSEHILFHFDIIALNPQNATIISILSLIYAFIASVLIIKNYKKKYI